MRTLHNVHKLNTFKVVVWDLEVRDNALKTMEFVCNGGIGVLKITKNLSISSSVFNPPQLSVASLPPVSPPLQICMTLCTEVNLHPERLTCNLNLPTHG